MSRTMPDVAFVADSLAIGGAERQLTYMVRVLRDAGSRVHVFTLAEHGAFADDVRACGADVTSIGPSGTSHVKRLVRLVHGARAFTPAIVQSAHFHTNIYAAVVGWILRVPSIGAVRNSMTFSLERVPRFGRLSLRLPTVVAANSRAAITESGRLGFDAGSFALLPNVVDTEVFAPASAFVSAAELTVCWVGTSKPEKRADLVTRAFVRAFSDTADARLVVHGGERWHGEIRAEAAAAGLTDHVELLAAGDPLPTYRRSDVLVLPSDVEGTPNVVLEAMACGLAVVATAVGDVPELLDGGRGVLVPPNDPDALALALRQLRDDPDRRLELGRAARRRVEESRSLPGLRPALEQLYHHTMRLST
jgi:glycosyltransferase involved in cell wall biosynthesis